MGKNTQSLNPSAQKPQKVLREFSAGGVVFKKVKNETLWLVTEAAVLPNSLFSAGTWRLTKGWLDNKAKALPGPLASGERRATEEEIQRAALREVSEEGGVEAKIIRKIETIKFSFNGFRGKVLKFVTFYLMEWTVDLPEGTDFETSEVAWLPFEEAYDRLTYRGEKEILKKAKEILEN